MNRNVCVADRLCADACRGGADDDAHAAGQRGRGADPHAPPARCSESFHALDAGFILLQDTSWLYPERTVQLYFAGANGKLQAEKRAISYESPEDLLENTLQALIAGRRRPAAIAGTCRDEASGRACDGNAVRLCCRRISACDTGREAASLAVRSVVATLCAERDRAGAAAIAEAGKISSIAPSPSR